MKIRYAGSTHVGLRRAHNEDSLRLYPEENLYVVADGMGGHASGEVASKLAVDSLVQFYVDTADDHEKTWPYREDRERSYDENRLITGIKLSNLRIYEKSVQEPQYKGMGTTIVVLWCGREGAYLAHVGDSRGYVWRSGQLKQLSEDHSLLNDYLKVHALSPEEIANFPHKNVIVRALGMKDNVVVDVVRLAPQAGDIYLLCSDGLSGMLSDEEIAAEMRRCGTDLALACTKLIEKANHNGGHDNITAILIGFFAS